MNISKLKSLGFEGFKTVGELMDNPSRIPAAKGVYAVLYLGIEIPKFLPTGTGGHFKGKDPNVTIDTLKQAWNGNPDIVYIGKANKLQSRLKQYLDFGRGKDIGHWGGRYTWQLEDSRDLVVCWKILSNNIEPRDYEAQLITEYKNSHNGKRPFANLKD